MDDADELRFVSDVDIVVTLWQSISSRLLHILFESDRSRTPGIIAATTEGRLAKVVARLLADRTPRAGRPRRVDVLPSVPLGSHLLDGRVLCGGKSSVDELRTVLSSQAELLVIAAHSDGIDADLSPAVLCPFPLEREQSSNLTCVLRSWCHRTSAPLKAALLGGLLISPATIKAKLLLMLTCHSVIPNEGAEYNAVPLLERIIVDGQVSCTVAMWGVGFLAHGEVDRIARIFQSGGTAGAAMRQLLALDLVREGRGRFALFGDPELTLRPGYRQLETPPEQQTLGSLPNGRSFLASLLDGCRRNDRTSTKESTKRFAQVVEKYPDGLNKSEVQKATIEVVAAFGTMPIKQWLADSIKLQATSPIKSKCSTCGSLCIHLETDGFRRLDARTVISCPTCGIAKDYTTSLGPLDIEISQDRTVTLRTGSCEDSWEACLIVEYSKDQASIVMPVQAVDGLLSARLPEGLPSGIIVICGVFACAIGVSLARAQVALRSDLSAVPSPLAGLT